LRGIFTDPSRYLTAHAEKTIGISGRTHFIVGCVLLVAACWLVFSIADIEIFSALIEALPVAVVLWAFWPKSKN
jgi:hypothetical protein